MRERTENRPQKGIETRCGGRGATRPTASAARLRLPISECTRWFNTDAVKGLSLTASLSSASSAIFIWLRMLFSLTTKRGCAASGVPPDGRRGVAVAIEAWRLRAPSRRVVRPSGSPRIPVTKARVPRDTKTFKPLVDGTKILRVLSSEQIGVKMCRAERIAASLELQVNNHGVRFQTKRVVTPPKSKVLVACLRLIAKRLVRRFLHRLVRSMKP